MVHLVSPFSFFQPTCKGNVAALISLFMVLFLPFIGKGKIPGPPDNEMPGRLSALSNPCDSIPDHLKHNLDVIQGLIRTENDQSVEGVVVGVQYPSPPPPFDNPSFISDKYGKFLMSIPCAPEFSITPALDANPLYGLNTYDLLLINKHLLGVQPLGSPYKILAADANRSGSLTTADVVELRKLLLGVYDHLPENTSWRFVDKRHVFSDLKNPFADIIPESIPKDRAFGTYTPEFVGIKVGDVNNSAISQSPEISGDCNRDTLYWQTTRLLVREGETFSLTFEASRQTAAWQFTLTFSDLELLQVIPIKGISAENYFFHHNRNALAFSGDSPEIPAFRLILRAGRNGWTSEMLHVNGNILEAEGYSETGHAAAIALRFSENETPKKGFLLRQNRPNPFSRETAIPFCLPESGNVTLMVFNTLGKELHHQTAFFPKGENAFRLLADRFPDFGLLYYTIQTPKEHASKWMIRENP